MGWRWRWVVAGACVLAAMVAVAISPLRTFDLLVPKDEGGVKVASDIPYARDHGKSWTYMHRVNAQRMRGCQSSCSSMAAPGPVARERAVPFSAGHWRRRVFWWSFPIIGSALPISILTL